MGVVVYKTRSSNKPIKEIEANRDPNIYSSPQSRGRDMIHHGDYETKEGDEMLYNEKFIRKVSEWREGADEYPKKNAIRSHAYARLAFQKNV